MRNPALTKTRVNILEDGTRTYTKMCPRCRKEFTTSKCQQVYCSDACKEKYNKAKKSKSRSGKRYVRKHSVSRAMEASARALSRRLATTVLKPVDFITGEEFNSWEYLQIHHIDLNCFNTDLSNLAILTPQSHDFLHKQVREKFGKKIDDELYLFGRGIYNYESEEEYAAFLKKRDEVVAFERSLFKVEFGVKLPEFRE